MDVMHDYVMEPVRSDRIDSMQVIEWKNQMIKLESWSIQKKTKPKLWFFVLSFVSNFPVKRRRHKHHTMYGVSRDACQLNTHSLFKRYFCFFFGKMIMQHQQRHAHCTYKVATSLLSYWDIRAQAYSHFWT